MPYKNLEITPAQYSKAFTAQESHFYKGFSTVATTNTRSTELYDLDLIKQDFLNLFNTKLGERVMQPQFGTAIWSLIFEPFTDNVKQAIADDVNRICNYDPRVIPTQIKMDEKEYGMLLEITLQLVNSNQSVSMSLNFDREAGLIAQ
jgi:phage baseplate assembly protein W